jgi:hypothetical protein
MTHVLVNHHISGHLLFVLVFTKWVVMCPENDNPASFEICTVIRFILPKDTSVAEIHSGLCEFTVKM